MTDQNAAIAEDVTTSEDNEVVIEGQETTNAPEDTATSDTEASSDTKPVEVDEKQKALNKLAFEKREEKRRADELQRQLNELQAKPEQSAQVTTKPVMPKEADFEFDTEKYSQAMSDYTVKLAQYTTQETLKQHVQNTSKSAEEARLNSLYSDFDKKVSESGIKDFYKVTANLPEFDGAVRDAMMQSENAPQLVHYLSEHLDVADIIASSNPVVAAMKIGEISTRIANAKTTNNISTAPDPIETLNQSGASTAPKDSPLLDGCTFE